MRERYFIDAVDEVLYAGLDDWIQDWQIWDIAATVSATESDTKLYSLGLICSLVSEGLFVPGDFTRDTDGFEAWNGSTEALVGLSCSRWLSATRFPVHENLLWLNITNEGRQRALALNPM